MTVARPGRLQHLPLHLRKKNLTRLLTQRPDGIFDAPYEVGEISLAVPCEKRGDEERTRQPQFSRGGNRVLSRIIRLDRCLDLPSHLNWAVTHSSGGKVGRLALLPGSIGRIGLRCHWACLHRLLKRVLLESPGVLRACQFVPPLGLSNPFSPIPGLKPRPLQAMLFHSRAMILTHRLSSVIHTLFLLLRQSHHDYATELFLESVVGSPSQRSFSPMRASGRKAVARRQSARCDG